MAYYSTVPGHLMTWPQPTWHILHCISTDKSYQSATYMIEISSLEYYKSKEEKDTTLNSRNTRWDVHGSKVIREIVHTNYNKAQTYILPSNVFMPMENCMLHLCSLQARFWNIFPKRSIW